MTRRFVFAALMFLAPLQIAGQEINDPRLTVERIFDSEEFAEQRLASARWLSQGAGYTTLESSPTVAGGEDIVRHDAAGGNREVLVSAEALIPTGETEAIAISEYTWSPDGRYLLIFTDTRRVWRANTRGDYWLLEREKGALRRLGGDAPPSTLMFATFSPDSKKIAYVRENNLYVEDIRSGSVKELTTDGSDTIINGTFDWVYEEEFGLRNGFRWSPDSEQIAYWQLDSNGVGRYFMLNTTDAIYSKPIPVQYPKVGTTNSSCRIGIVSIKGGSTRWLRVPGDPRNHYIARMDWADNSDEVILQHLNRLQNTNLVMIGSAKNGAVRTVITERDEAWLEVGNNLIWTDGGQKFVWMSERDGWRHLYLVSRSGRAVLLTPGAYDVISVEHVDESGGWVYFLASPDNPTQRYLYRVSLDGSGTNERMTPPAQMGTHSYQMSPDATWAFHTFSSFDVPPVTELIRLPNHETIRTLVDNRELKAKLQSLGRPPTRFLRIDIGGGVSLDAWLLEPQNFDPSRKYPLFFHVYGEPAGQTVLDRWGGKRHLWHQMLAQRGYLVMSVDNRGTPGPRGREWRKSVYRQIGILASEDQAAAARSILERFEFADSQRVGIWGWSGGGSMTLNMIFRYPDIYHTGMAVAVVSNQRYYDTIYQERYMGLPEDNPDGYRDGSPITFAHRLKGNLLLVHGTGDDNVHYQNFEALTNELIRHKKQFTMMSYPNRTHAIREGENTTLHLYTLMTNFLLEHLPPH